MTDRDLLELAAKAAGVEIATWSNCQPGGFVKGESGVFWNPLTGDGYALRLAVKLNLSMRFDTLNDGHIAAVTAEWSEDFDGYWWNEWLGKDPAAAMRRAIVRAAAAIGEKM